MLIKVYIPIWTSFQGSLFAFSYQSIKCDSSMNGSNWRCTYVPISARHPIFICCPVQTSIRKWLDLSPGVRDRSSCVISSLPFIHTTGCRRRMGLLAIIVLAAQRASETARVCECLHLVITLVDRGPGGGGKWALRDGRILYKSVGL